MGVTVKEEVPKEPVSLLALLKVTSAMCGVFLMWALEQVYTTPYLQEIGFPITVTSMVWMAGPITGIIGQAVIGVLSDKCTSKYGRRSPFIAGGTAAIALSALMFSNAKDIGETMGDTKDNRVCARVIAVIFFITLDFALNAVQCPIKALVVDVCPQKQQTFAYGILSCAAGFGYFVGYILGSFHTAKVLTFMSSDIQASFALGNIAMLVFVGITFLSIREKKHELTEEEASSTVREELKKVCDVVLHMPRLVARTFIVQLFTWIALGVNIAFATDFVGKVIYKGDPNADMHTSPYDNYLNGVHVGARGMAISSAVSTVCAPILPILMKHTSIKLIYLSSQIIQTVCMLGPCIFRSELSVLFFFSILGFNLAGTQTIPWALTAIAAQQTKSRATYLAAMNVSQCIPILIVALFGGMVVSLFGSPTSVFVIASISGALGAVAILGLDTSGITIDLAYKLTEDDDVLEDDLSSTATHDGVPLKKNAADPQYGSADSLPPPSPS